MRSERAEWELPSGRLELDETPQEYVVREIPEETDWPAACGPIPDNYVCQPVPSAWIFLVTYGCYVLRREERRLSAAHNDIDARCGPGSRMVKTVRSVPG